MENFTYDLIIARYGEIGIKSPKVRKKFENKLVQNIKSSLNADIYIEDGRIFIYPKNFKKALKSLKRIFGIVSFSPAIKTSAEFNEIKNKLVDYVRRLGINKKMSFAIRPRRVGNHEFTSQDLAEFAGDVVVKETGAKVDLDNPDIEIFIEVRHENSYIYHEIVEGPGGLPVGTQGKVIGLLSGGIDSPVALYLMMKRGCSVTALHFDIRPFTIDGNIKKVKKISEVLESYSSGEFELLILKYGDVLKKIKKIAGKSTCIVCRHLMYKIAEKIAKKKNAHAIVDGNSLGQVASQTLPNILTTHYGIEIPILSPLIGMDKTEIRKIAEKIGTYEISCESPDICKAVPKHPVTYSTPKKLTSILDRMDVDEILKKY